MRYLNKFWVPMLVLGLFVVIGVSVHYHHNEMEETAIADQTILDRAYEDAIAGEDADDLDAYDQIIIKIFGEDDELIDSRVLKPEELPDEEFKSLMNKSSLMAEYNNSYIYKIKD